MLAITKEQLKALKPCGDAYARVSQFYKNAKSLTAAQARDAGATFDDVLWAASAVARANPDVERRLRLWAADCAARVLGNYEQLYPTDDRPRNAIMVSRQHARGMISNAARTAAWSAARTAESVARTAACSAARSAESAAASAAWSAACSVESSAWSAACSVESSAWSAACSVESSAWSAACSVESAAHSAESAARAAAWSTESVARRTTSTTSTTIAARSWQFERLCQWLSDKEPED